MPKKGASRNSNPAGDVTIYEFADSKLKDSQNSRIKKKNNEKWLTSQVTLLQIDPIDDEIVRKRSQKSRTDTEDDHIYTDYPVDVWYLISNFICPEQIQQFSLICRKTAAVCSSARFWFQMYRKYCQRGALTMVDQLPERLRPSNMRRLNGLRMAVIRNFFYTYSPMHDRLRFLAVQDFHSLTGRQCIASWYTQQKDQWIFCFKLKQRFAPNSRQDIADRRLRAKEWLKLATDIYTNSEEGCTILVITSIRFHPMPKIYGETVYLGKIQQSLSHGFTAYKISMNFTNYQQQTITGAIFDPAIHINVLDWWTPAYDTYLNNV